MDNRKSMNMIFRAICGIYLIYLGIKIVKGDGGGRKLILAMGVFFIVVGAVVVLTAMLQFFKGGMRDLTEGEEPDDPQKEPEPVAEPEPEHKRRTPSQVIADMAAMRAAEAEEYGDEDCGADDATESDEEAVGAEECEETEV